MSLLYLLACIIAILIIIVLLFYLIPDIKSGALLGTAAEQTFKPSNYENLVEIAVTTDPCGPDADKEIRRLL